MALLTVAQLKAKLGLSDNTEDAELQAMITAVVADINAFVGGFDPETTSYTEYLSPTGGAELSLPCPNSCPVTITTIHEDTDRTFGSDTLLTSGTDYIQKTPTSPTVIRIGRNWPYMGRREVGRLAGTVYPYPRVVKAVYTVDTAGLVAAAKGAAMLECRTRYRIGQGDGMGPVTSESVDGLSESVATDFGGKTDTGYSPFRSPQAFGVLKTYRKFPLA